MNLFRNCLPPLYAAAAFLFAVNTSAQWLVWRAPELVREPAQVRALSWDKIISSVPSQAVSNDSARRLPVALFIAARQNILTDFFENLGYELCPKGFLSNAGQALGSLKSGKRPGCFPPPAEYILNAQRQDVSFARLEDETRIGILVWRLPFKTTRGLPVWACAIESITTKEFYDSVKKSPTRPEVDIKPVKQKRDKEEVTVLEIRAVR